MNTSFDTQWLNELLRDSDVTAETRVKEVRLALQDNPELARAPHEYWIHKAVNHNVPELIPLFLAAGVDLNAHPPGKDSPIVCAAQRCQTEAMLQLARAHATFDRSRLLTLALRQGLAFSGSFKKGEEHLQALRQLGYTRSELEAQLHEQHLLCYAKTGVNYYLLAKCPLPPDPLDPDTKPLDHWMQDQELLYKNFRQEVQGAVRQFPKGAWEMRHFIDPVTHEASEYMPYWEGLGLVDAAFSPVHAKHWKQGVAGMLATYDALPEYVKVSIDAIPLRREALSPQESSVLVSYARGAVATRMAAGR